MDTDAQRNAHARCTSTWTCVGVVQLVAQKLRGCGEKPRRNRSILRYLASPPLPPTAHAPHATRPEVGARRTGSHHHSLVKVISRSSSSQNLSEHAPTLPVVHAHCTSTCTIQHPLALRRSFKCIIRVREPVHINNKE